MAVVLLKLAPLLVLLICPGTSSSLPALKFGQTVDDFIIFQPDMTPLQNALTVCAWVKKLSTLSTSDWMAYSTSSNNHELLFSDGGVHNYFMESNLNLASVTNPTVGAWSHHCTSWSTSSNKRKTYFEGKLVGESNTPARTLGLGGYIFFNNENHYDGGSRDTSEVFGGELFKVNFFTKELTGEEILEMKEAGLCSDVEEKYGRFRYLRWEDILLEERTGNITEVSIGCPAPECKEEKTEETEPATQPSNETECECPACSRWDVLYEEEFFNQTLSHGLLEQLRSYWNILGNFVGATVNEEVIAHFKIFYATKEACGI
ncbi:hypothetical protein ACHWQZ_G004794 [Mnemiopsis leidyi]